jgi:hypothetical protein
VLVRTFNRSMFNGYLSEEQMLHEHPLELADIKAGEDQRPSDPKAEAKRKSIFWPVYGVIGALLMVGIFLFVSFEETAVADPSSPETVEVFVPLTPTPLPTIPPSPTPQPVSEGGGPSTWEGGIGSLFQQCVSCHGDSALGGLNVSSYASTLAGGGSGPGIVPGDPDASQIIIVQESGDHPVVFSDADLQAIRSWIEAGALEK